MSTRSPSANLVEAYLKVQDSGVNPNRDLARPSRPDNCATLHKPSLETRRAHALSRSFSTMDPNQSMGGNHSFANQSYGNMSAGNISFAGSSNSSFGQQHPGQRSQWSDDRINQIQARLARRLGPEYVTQRPGPGGSAKLSYIEGWKVINLANEVFGFDGWSSNIVSLTTDYLDVNKEGRVSVNVTALIRITLRDGSFHEDVGCGQGENIRGKGAALDKAQKEAVTDGTKRALRTFGNVLGNCLYDKNYTKEVVKMKIPPARFDQNDLERRAEFTPQSAASTSNAGPSRASPIPQHMNNAPKQPIPVQNPVLPPRNLHQQAPQPQHANAHVPGTPMKSINDPQPGSTDEFDIDENFDAEFMDFGSDSILEQMDDQALKIGLSSGNLVSGQAIINYGTLPKPEALVYQHRQRPDIQRSPSDSNQSNNPSINPPQQHSGEVRPGQNASGSTMIGQKVMLANSPRDGQPGTPVVAPLPQVPAQVQPHVEPSKPRPVGEFAFPITSNAPDRQQTRAQAIANALNAARGPTRSIHPESPRIPSGGIDAVAQRASNKLMAEGARLGLDENEEVDLELKLGGFSSARGVKRLGDDRRSPSPIKTSGQFSKQGQGQPGRPIIRTALGELSFGEGNDWAAKRSRLS